MTLGVLWPAWGAAQTLQESASQGLSWLQAQVQPDGSLASESQSRALVFQVHGETLHTLKYLGSALPSGLQTRLESTPGTFTELLARRALARQQAQLDDGSALSALMTLQNADGGFGAASGYASNALDTAWALKGLGASRQNNSEAAKKARAWLLSIQRQDGSWSLAIDSDDLLTTAIAADALWRHRQVAQVQAPLERARQWLLAQRAAGGTWSSTEHSSQALLAILPGLSDTSSIQPAISRLLADQSADGSWAGDAYLTALALRVLSQASQPSPNPDLASLTGRVIDAASGLPVVGARIALQGAQLQVLSDAQGGFEFTHLNAGSEQLQIVATGYRSLSSALTLQIGQRLAMGELRMIAGGGDDVVLAGVARYTNSSGNFYVASNALIKVGTLETRSDAQGNYRLAGIPAGTLNVQATYSNYPQLSAQMSAAAGQVVTFDPLFKTTPPVSGSRVTVTVTEAAGGTPLASTSVKLNSSSATTNAQGQVVYTTGMVLGKNTMEVGKAGYERVLITFDAFENQSIDIPVVLRAVTGNQTILRGKVVDQATQLPLSAVAVSASSAGLSTQTNARGEYEMVGSSLAGTHSLSFEKSGYEVLTTTITVSANRTNLFEVGLKPKGTLQPSASLSVSVLDRANNQPIVGAEVVLTGSNQQVVKTDVDGTAFIDRLHLHETRVQINAPGFESVFAVLNVKPGQLYQLPVELLAEQSARPGIYGYVIDAVSRQPLAGVPVTLSGAHAESASTDAQGRYAFVDVTPGNITLNIQRSGYETFDYAFNLTGTLEVNAALTPGWQDATAQWEVFGNLVDADTLEPIAGAELLLEEVIPGSAVVAQQSAVSLQKGDFVFEGLTEKDARVLISMTGYDTTLLPFVREKGASQSLGTIKLKKSYNAALPDLMLASPDRSGLVLDPNTFVANGRLSVRVRNNSNYDAAAFDVSAFVDTNSNQLWDEGVDQLLAVIRVPGLVQQEERGLDFNLDQVQLPFRDAPIYLMIDSGLEVIENIEGNNTLRASVSCGGGGGVQDVAVCIDTSGSVSHLYNLEMDGVIKAVENPNIIPHDGSVRFTLGTDWEMYYGGSDQKFTPLHQAQVVEPATLPSLISDLKSKRNPGGYSSGPKCALKLSEYLNRLSPQGSSKTLILVGDGYWEGLAATRTQLPLTVANGIDRIDVIGLGSVNLQELEENAWPKPVNGRVGGKVTVANTAGEVAAAMARALGDSVQSIDLTLGNLRLFDQGAGQPVRLSVRVGNAGSASNATQVRFYQGNQLLGEVAVPAMRTGEYHDLSLASVQLVSDEPIRAVLDESRANAECNRANNSQTISPAAANRLASLSLLSDQAAYLPQTAIRFDSVARNLGQYAAELRLQLSVVDDQSREVASFPLIDLGSLGSSLSRSQDQAWNSGLVAAGSYRVLGRLLDRTDQVVAEAHADFSILAVAPGQQAAALRLSTDRAEYLADDRVQLETLTRNLASNRAISNARLILDVQDPNNSRVFSHTEALAEIASGGLRAFDIPQPLSSAPLGDYRVEAVLVDESNQVLAQASALYQVVSQRGPLLSALSGSVDLARPAVQPGESQHRNDQIRNDGSTLLSGLRVARVLMREGDSQEIGRVEETLELAVGAQKQWPALGIATASLTPDTYVAALLVEEGGSWRALSVQTFAVQGVAAGAPEAIPTIGEWGQIALALLMLLVGVWAQRRNAKNSDDLKGAC